MTHVKLIIVYEKGTHIYDINSKDNELENHLTDSFCTFNL